VHHIHVHRYGERAEVTFHVRFPEGTSLEHAHRVASDLEERIRQSLGVEATIHLEPRDRSGRGRP
jgi:divalent metal cation (Fe/Co/Zn/Cd) transporter